MSRGLSKEREAILRTKVFVATNGDVRDLLAEIDRLREVAETYSAMHDNACFEWAQENDRLRAALTEIAEHWTSGNYHQTRIAREALEQK